MKDWQVKENQQWKKRQACFRLLPSSGLVVRFNHSHHTATLTSRPDLNITYFALLITLSSALPFIAGNQLLPFSCRSRVITLQLWYIENSPRAHLGSRSAELELSDRAGTTTDNKPSMATDAQTADVSTSIPTEASKAQDSVEMSTLQSPPTAQPVESTSQAPTPLHTDLDTTAGASQSSPSQSRPTPTTRLTRAQSEALGPATESPITPPTAVERGPTLSITLMLTTGARHPYKIDEKYLRNRKVELPTTGAFDPRDISGYKLKELIWTDWRAEWEPKPATPSSIRLILLGRFVEDKSALRGEF